MKINKKCVVLHIRSHFTRRTMVHLSATYSMTRLLNTGWGLNFKPRLDSSTKVNPLSGF